MTTVPRAKAHRRRQGIKAAAAVIFSLAAASAQADDAALGVRVPEGFQVSLYADDDLAHDIYSLTIDSFGRVVVSGAGYVRILIDADKDGRAESFQQFAEGPETGAQGMYFHGRDLMCRGDFGLLRYRDADGDDAADGPPDVLLKIKAGGEHDAHAIRRGPDGWWYVIAGNNSGVNAAYVTLSSSPVRTPEQGVVMRFKPDLSGGEVVADGFRNAYDIDFLPSGELYTFDSDGEREISLPWYQPTRVFEVVPGAHAGWLSRNWKRPDYFFDMPPVLGAFGRGSPTGVACYRHTQFPVLYRGALFVLDWTYGRVFALPIDRQGGRVRSEPITFMSAVGEHGFAPTDADIGPEGALYICVGGRGTRGAVYRVSAVGAVAEAGAGSFDALNPQDQLAAVLTAPQPLSSWSRRQWEPVSEQLGALPFLEAIRDTQRSPAERVRAIEIATEKFGGLDAELTDELAASTSVDVRARAAWSLGRSPHGRPALLQLARFLEDEAPQVHRAALEGLLGAPEEVLDELSEIIGERLASSDPFARMAAARLLGRMGPGGYARAAAVGVKHGWASAVMVASGFADRKPGYQSYPVEIARRILVGERPLPLKIEAARLLQRGLGDLAPPEGTVPGVFEGYAARVSLESHREELGPVAAAVAELFPTGEESLDSELLRALAILQPEQPEILDQVLAGLTPASHPVDDLHRLIVAARLPAPRTREARNRIAAALVQLDAKIQARELPIDSNWDDRVTELHEALVEADAELPGAMLAQPEFGRPGHVTFVSALPPDKYPETVAAFLRQIEADPDYAWNNDVVFLMGESSEPAVRTLVRSKIDDFALRNAVLMTLAEAPEDSDRAQFLAALADSPVEVMAACVNALLLLPVKHDAAEQVALARALRRLGAEGQERETRDQLVELLQRCSQESSSYVFGRDGDAQQPAIEEWTAYAQRTFPEEYARQEGDAAQEQRALQQLLGDVDWDEGDVDRGHVLFEKRACVQCHGGRRALGPDLQGAAQRFSRDDLFTAIALPHRDVSPRYQTTLLATRSGQVYTGLIVYESVDGLVLRNALNQTFRIESRDIDVRRTLNQSLMPSGLLKDLGASDLADLYAYLRSLRIQTAQSADSPGER